MLVPACTLTLSTLKPHAATTQPRDHCKSEILHARCHAAKHRKASEGSEACSETGLVSVSSVANVTSRNLPATRRTGHFIKLGRGDLDSGLGRGTCPGIRAVHHSIYSG